MKEVCCLRRVFVGIALSYTVWIKSSLVFVMECYTCSVLVLRDVVIVNHDDMGMVWSRLERLTQRGTRIAISRMNSDVE